MELVSIRQIRTDLVDQAVAPALTSVCGVNWL
jgi:hypothetical protein